MNAFVHELLVVAMQLHAVLSHMERSVAASGARVADPPLPDALGSLLLDILSPLRESRRPQDCELATGVLSEVAALVEDQLVLVPLDAG